MIAEVKQKYRGVLCRHCCQAIPLSPSAERRGSEFEDQVPGDADQFNARSFTLRCRACDGEGLYTPVDVIDCDGTPRMRGSYARKRLSRVSKNVPGESGGRNSLQNGNA
jgi:hypothetical protein